jgi:hypothetical protein
MARAFWKWLSVASLALPSLAVGAQQVTLPLSQYEDLRARASPPPEAAPAPPAPFALELADFDIEAGPESARVVQTLRFTLYDGRWQTVPLGETGSFIRADFAGGEGRVRMVEKGWSLQVRGLGRHEVKLESVVPVTRDETATRPTWRLGLKAPMAAVVRGRLTAPASVEDAGADEPVVVDRMPGGAWRFAAPAGAEIRWTLAGKAVVPRRAQLPLRFEATTATASTVLHTRFKVLGWVGVRVAQGRLETLRVPIPAGLAVVEVRGPVTEWKLDGATLVVTPLSPVEDSLAVEMDLSGEPRDRFATPLLIPEGSARTTLLAKAFLQGDGVLSLSEPGAARGAEKREEERLPAALREASGRLFVVTDPARPPAWEAAWAERTEMLAAQVDRLLVDVAAGEAGRASYQLWAEVRNRGAQQLSFTLPAGFELVEAQRDGSAVAPGLAAGAVAVPLLTQEAPQIVHLLGVVPLPLPRAEGAFEVALPALSAPAARVEVRVVLPGGRSYELADAARAGAVGPPPRAAARAKDNAMARQVAQAPRTAPAAADAALFPCPPGFIQVGAAWSALSATPLPLSLRARKAKEKLQWF